MREREGGEAVVSARLIASVVTKTRATFISKNFCRSKPRKSAAGCVRPIDAKRVSVY